MPRYHVTGLPPQAGRGLSAFLPHFNRLAASGAQQYKDGVTGHPGTIGIGITEQARGPAPSVAAIAMMGGARSQNAPDTIWPNQYWTLPERNYRPGLLVQMYDPVRPQDTTMIPVPAVSLRQHYLRRAALLSGGIQNSGSSPSNVQQPVSQLIAWARRLTGNNAGTGTANG